MGGDILRGNTETVILRCLLEEDSYGYEISKFFLSESDGQIEIKDATIYQAFRRMENDGLISAYWGDGVLGARRRYYKATDKGRKYYFEKLSEWEKTKIILDNLIIGRSIKK